METIELLSEVLDDTNEIATTMKSDLSVLHTDEMLRHTEVWRHIDELIYWFLDSEYTPGGSRQGIGRLVPIIPRFGGEYPILARDLGKECRAASLSAMRFSGLLMAVSLLKRKHFRVDQAKVKNLEQQQLRRIFSVEINGYAETVGTLHAKGNLSGELITLAGLSASTRISALAKSIGIHLPPAFGADGPSMLTRCMLFHASTGFGAVYQVASTLYAR